MCGILGHKLVTQSIAMLPIHSFIHSTSLYLLSTYSMPDIVLDAMNSTVNKTKSLPSWILNTSGEGRKQIRKYTYNTMQRRDKYY